jgi:hypothetical protein
MKTREDSDKKNISGQRRDVPTPTQKREQMSSDMPIDINEALQNPFACIWSTG